MNRLAAGQVANRVRTHPSGAALSSRAKVMRFHDRFLILDDKELYLIGASLKDLGKKCFAVAKLDPTEIAGLKAHG